MKNNHKFTQKRTLDFKITNLVSVDIDLLKLKLQSLSEEKLLEKIEKAWVYYISGEGTLDSIEEDVFEAFKLAGVKAELIKNSLRVRSKISSDCTETDDLE